jgi:hypothetical protein
MRSLLIARPQGHHHLVVEQARRSSVAGALDQPAARL